MGNSPDTFSAHVNPDIAREGKLVLGAISQLPEYSSLRPKSFGLTHIQRQKILDLLLRIGVISDIGSEYVAPLSESDIQQIRDILAEGNS